MRNRSILASALAWLLCGAALAENAGWERIDHEHGITVMRRKIQGCSLPAFRGRGVIKGAAPEMMAMMTDIRGVAKWAYGVDKARVLKRIDRRTDVIYLYSDIPWPVRDRDMIVRRTVKVLEPGVAFEIRLQCEPDAVPEVDGAVRVRTCGSRFRLRNVAPARTDLDYVMRLDPGGFLPSWTANWVAKTVPLKTLVAIESHTASTRRKYSRAARRWSVHP